MKKIIIFYIFLTFLLSQSNQRDYALKFDGDDDYVEVSGLLGKLENITVSAWAKTSSNQRGEVISIGDYVAIRLNDGGSHKGFFYKNEGGWHGTSVDTTLSPGWHFFTYSNYDSASSRIQKFYIDGIEVARSAQNSSIKYSGLGSHTRIGMHGNNTTYADFHGSIREVSVWNNGLDSLEVSSLFNNGKPTDSQTNLDNYISASKLIAYWKFTEGSGDSLLDVTGNGFDGIIINATWKVKSPILVPGYYLKIQDAVDAAHDGDSIFVAAGTYKENVELINPDGGPFKSISIVGEDKETTIIDGNFNENKSVFRIQRNKSLFLKNLTLKNGTGFEESGAGVNISSGTAVLDSLIISNNSTGGGVWCTNVNLTIKNSIFMSNSTNHNGGALTLIGDGDQTNNTISISNSIFDSNTSKNQGGAIWVQKKNISIINSEFLNNSSSSKGTVYLEHSSAFVENTKLINNISGGNDAALRGASSSVKMFSSLVANNKGGGLYFGNADSSVVLDYVTVVNNSDDMGIYVNTNVEIINSIISGNDSKQLIIGSDGVLSVSNSNIEGGETKIENLNGTLSWGNNNIDKNPYFVKVITNEDEESDYHLKDWSPLIGAAKASAEIITDIEGNPRPNPTNTNPDMGAYENKWGSPQNAPPVLSKILDSVFNEDGSITITLKAINADNADNDVILFSAVSDTNAIIPSLSSSILTITPIPDWNGDANITIYASDGIAEDSTKFKLIVIPVQDPPSEFDWVSTALDTINLTQSNLTSLYDLEWTVSNDVDGDSINYLLFAKIGVYEEEEIWDTTSTKVQISYSEILEGVFEGQPINAATVKFTVKSTDGIDTVNVTGDDRVLYVSRYEYLSTESDLLPTEYALHENYPNPFNPSTTLRFDLPYAGDVSLTIYNMLGQKVKLFDMRGIQAGKHTLRWNATNDYGDPVGAGVYLYQLHTKDFVKTRKMVLLK